VVPFLLALREGGAQLDDPSSELSSSLPSTDFSNIPELMAATSSSSSAASQSLAIYNQMKETTSQLPKDWAKWLHLEGVFTHLSKADESDKSYTHRQIHLFDQAVHQMHQLGFYPAYLHATNSAGTMDHSQTFEKIHRHQHTSGDVQHGNEKVGSKKEPIGINNPKSKLSQGLQSLHFARIGISLYGMYASDEMTNPDGIQLQPVLSWKTKIIQVKKLPPGSMISYGGTFVTFRDPFTLVATIPLGYADGFRRLMSSPPMKPTPSPSSSSSSGTAQSSVPSAWSVLVRGQRVPIVGRVCMDMIMLDITDAAASTGEISEGEEVVLVGNQGEEEISVDDMAKHLKTINYEVTCLVGKRVPRLFFREKKLVGVHSMLGRVYSDSLLYNK
jgi:alanine racemase